MTIHEIEHPNSYMEGVRVAFLKSRHRDGSAVERTITRVSHSPGEFARNIAELKCLMRPRERIYVSAGARDLVKASHHFRRKQLEVNIAGEDDEVRFYTKFEGRWVSCLMSPEAQKQDDKVWLFDCDSTEEAELASAFVNYNNIPCYKYASKSGTHYLVRPFNRSLLDWKLRDKLVTNAMMLWAYSTC